MKLTDPTPTPDPQVEALTRIAEAVEHLAFQQETANLLSYNGQPMTQVKQRIGKRLGIPTADSTEQQDAQSFAGTTITANADPQAVARLVAQARRR